MSRTPTLWKKRCGLKEKHGGEVIALSLGPERVKQTIKEALAKGADRGIHIADDNFAQLDPLGAAKVLAAAIASQKCDLVLTGLQSDDHGFGQTGVLLAGLLNLPHATLIMQIEVLDGRLKLNANWRLAGSSGSSARCRPCFPFSLASTRCATPR